MKLITLLYAPARQYEQEFGSCPIPDHVAEGLDTGEKGDKVDPYIVSFNDTPRANARNWSNWMKAKTTIDITMIALQTTFASAISSTAVQGQMKDLNISEPVSQLSTAMFLLGFGLGGIPLPPLSEALGRQFIYVSTLTISSLFEIGCATAANGWTLAICRFFAGFFASTPLSVAGGTLMDLFTPVQRAYIFPLYASAGFLGPSGAPVIGGYLALKTGWRNNYWITVATGLALSLYLALFTRETLGDEILRHKARHFRLRTGDPKWRAPREKVPMKTVYKLTFTKVLKLLFTEPVVQFNTFYLTVIYILLFGDLEAYPVVFGEYHGFNNGQIGLAFVPICVGLCFTSVAMLFFANRYARIARENGHGRAPPEEHYLYMIFGGCLLPISIFWLGWTSFSSISVWVPMMSGLLFGFSLLFIFIATYQNVIDAYGAHAASGLGCLVLVRYIVAAGASIFVTPMFRNMKPWWACTLLGCIAVALIPVNVFLYVYGPKIRARSPFALHDL